MKPCCKITSYLIFILFVCSSHASAGFTKAHALEAINGYSLKVATDEGPKIVRLAEIICPGAALNTFPCKNEAKQFLQELISGKELTLVFWALDAVGRSVCRVFLPDGRSLGDIMVSKGYALQDQYYSSSIKLSRLEETARKKKLGVWKHIRHYKRLEG